MDLAKKSLVTILFLVVLPGLVCSLISPSQATDWIDDLERSQDTRTLKRGTKTQEKPNEIADDTASPVTAPTSAKMVKLSVHKGQKVKEGEELCVLEAMKMEFSIRSLFPREREIGSIYFQVGDRVDNDAILMELLPPIKIPRPLNASPSSNASPSNSSNAPPSNKGKENKAVGVRKGDDVQPTTPQAGSLSSLLRPLRESPVPELASTPLETASPSSFSPSVFPGMANVVSSPPPNNNTPPDNGGKFTQNTEEESTRPRSVQSVQTPEALLPSLKMESPSLKKRVDEEIKRSAQEKPSLSKSPAVQDASGYSIVACAKWVGGLMILLHLLLTLKAMAYSLLRRSSAKRVCPLRRSDHFNKHPFLANRRAHNRNRIGYFKRKVA